MEFYSQRKVRKVILRNCSSLCFPQCFLYLLQTFQKVKEWEKEDSEQLCDERSQLISTMSQPSLYRRKSTRGSSFVALGEAKKEDKDKEVSWGSTSLP